MEYDIIEKVAGLSAGNQAGDLPETAARVLMEAFSFDSCGIYIWSEETGVLTLKASCGDAANCVEKYSNGEGVPSLVMEKMLPVLLDAPFEKSGDKPFDPALAGFEFAAAYPLPAGTTLWGVLYFRARRVPELTEAQWRSLDVAVKTLVPGLVCADLRARYAAARREVLDTKARLAESEKLLALVDMASTLAHEIRSPLISIGGFTSRLRKKLRTGDSALRYVVRIESETARLENLMNGMMRFLQDTPVETALVDVNEVLEDALGFFTEDFTVHAIGVLKRMDKGPVMVDADRVQLKIAFDNLIVNAIQSMDSGGELFISTGRSNGKVVVTFSDNGGGIAPEDLENIFNPFFTTKSCGTGLGLPITKSIITRHNGTITVENNAGEGVSFSLSLPEAGEGAEAEGGPRD